MDRESLRRWHAELLDRKVRAVRILPAADADAANDSGRRFVFPGAFNPLHAGHRGMADFAAERFGRPVEFEISLVNVDKPPLALDDVVRRAEQFPPHETVWLTCAPRFTEKAELFAGATFVIGVDTLARLIEPRYYDGSETEALRAVEHIAAQGCRFLVFGRAAPSGFLSLAQLPLPESLAAICDEVTQEQFRQDVSSTQLRLADGG